MAKKREPDLTLDEYILKLRDIEIAELGHICSAHCIAQDNSSVYEVLEVLSAHAAQCDCPTSLLIEDFLPFEAQQMHGVGRNAVPYISFSYDGENSVITLDKPFIMPNLETLAEVLFHIAYKDSYYDTHMTSGDEITVGELLANSMVDEITIDGALWCAGKPGNKESIEKYAFAGDSYVIIGGSGSPGADDSGWSAICQLRSRILLFASDPGEWYDLGDITREQAIEDFRRDNEYLRLHPEQYEYSDWSLPKTVN